MCSINRWQRAIECTRTFSFHSNLLISTTGEYLECFTLLSFRPWLHLCAIYGWDADIFRTRDLLFQDFPPQLSPTRTNCLPVHYRQFCDSILCATSRGVQVSNTNWIFLRGFCKAIQSILIHELFVFVTSSVLCSWTIENKILY